MTRILNQPVGKDFKTLKYHVWDTSIILILFYHHHHDHDDHDDHNHDDDHHHLHHHHDNGYSWSSSSSTRRPHQTIHYCEYFTRSQTYSIIRVRHSLESNHIIRPVEKYTNLIHLNFFCNYFCIFWEEFFSVKRKYAKSLNLARREDKYLISTKCTLSIVTPPYF